MRSSLVLASLFLATTFCIVLVLLDADSTPSEHTMLKPPPSASAAGDESKNASSPVTITMHDSCISRTEDAEGSVLRQQEEIGFEEQAGRIRPNRDTVQGKKLSSRQVEVLCDGLASSYPESAANAPDEFVAKRVERVSGTSEWYLLTLQAGATGCDGWVEVVKVGNGSIESIGSIGGDYYCAPHRVTSYCVEGIPGVLIELWQATRRGYLSLELASLVQGELRTVLHEQRLGHTSEVMECRYSGDVSRGTIKLDVVVSNRSRTFTWSKEDSLFESTQ